MRERERLNGVSREDPSHREIYVGRTRGKQRRRARYRLFPGAFVSDLTGDVSVGIQEESGQTTTTTRGLVSNLRRIYPRKASRRLLPAPSTCGNSGRVHTFSARRQSVSPDSHWEIVETAAIYYQCLHPCTQTFYCERLEGN